MGDRTCRNQSVLKAPKASIQTRKRLYSRRLWIELDWRFFSVSCLIRAGRVSSKIRERRMRVAGHCVRLKEKEASKLVCGGSQTRTNQERKSQVHVHTVTICLGTPGSPLLENSGGNATPKRPARKNPCCPSQCSTRLTCFDMLISYAKNLCWNKSQPGIYQKEQFWVFLAAPIKSGSKFCACQAEVAFKGSQ